MSADAVIDRASSSNPDVLRLLATHPRVMSVVVSNSPGISFCQGSWVREVSSGQTDEDIYGLVEVMDNNPMVCADEVSVPGAATTLALIAIAPLIQAGLIADAPVVVLNFPDDGVELTAALARAGWQGGVTVHSEFLDVGGVLAATVMVGIQTPNDLDAIDSLYDEQFGRSFYVRRDETSVWDPAIVEGQPFAAYRLRISPDEPTSLLTVRVLADPAGKCGAGQLVHAMNVMCGYEESLGVS